MPDTPQAVIESHEEDLAALLENTLNDPTFIIEIAGAGRDVCYHEGLTVASKRIFQKTGEFGVTEWNVSL